MNNGTNGLDGDLRQRLMWTEQLRAVEEYEARLARQRVVPNAQKLPARGFILLLQAIGGCAIGLVVAMMAVFFNFFVFTKVLHLQ